MDFKQDTKLIAIEGYAQSHYLDKTAYGLIYIPYELYEKHQKTIDSMKFGTFVELGGNHSYLEGEVETHETTIKEIADKHLIEDVRLLDSYTKDIVYSLVYSLQKDYEDGDLLYDKIMQLSDEINKLIETEEKQMTIEEDMTINQTLIKKGSVLKVTYLTNPLHSDNKTLFSISFDEWLK